MSNMAFLRHSVRTKSLDDIVEENLPPAPRIGNSTQRIITHHLIKDGQKWVKINHRYQTTQADLRAPIGVPAEEERKISADHHLLYRAQSWNGNIDRLKAAGIDVSTLVEDHYEFCLPNSDNSKAELRIFDMLYLCPMLKTDQEISSIIPLEPSTASSPPTPPGQHFYIRTFELTPEELRHLINEMDSSGKRFPEVAEWRKVLDLFSPKTANTFDLEPPSVIVPDDHSTLPKTLAAEDPKRYGSKFSRFAKLQPQTYSIRYVGTVQGPRRPIDRFEEDLAGRKSGIMHEFLQVLEASYPLVYDAGRTSLIKHASLLTPDAPDALNRYNAPTRERFLIQTFGYGTLLNRMYGGWFTDYVPPYQDEQMYKKMKVVVYTDLLANGGTLDVQTFTQLKSHWDEVADFANANSGSTGTCRNKFTQAIQEAGFQQSIPSLYRNEIPLFVIIGKDITLGDYMTGSKFFDGKSQAATLTRNFLYRLISHESSDALAFDARAFPFVNLWRWLWHQDYQDAIRFLREYLQITRPLISLSLSREVNEIVQGNFTEIMDFPDGYITYTAGIPTIQYYDQEDKANSAFINIPHIHPGRDKYTSQNKPLRRVYDMSYQASLLLGKMATTMIDRFMDADVELPPREELCEKILTACNALGPASERYQRFFDEFEAARLAITSYRPVDGKGIQPKAPRGESTNYRLVANAEGRMKLMSFGQAEGEPNSQTRDSQLDRLWERNISILHSQVKRSPQRKDEWKDQFLGLPSGSYFLLKVLSEMKPEDFMEEILKHVRPDLAGNTDWLTESPARTKAILECGMWLALPKKQDGGELQRMYRHFPRTYVTAYDMQGRPIGVGDTGKIRLHWQKDDGTTVLVNLRCQAALPGVGEGNFVRSILFTEHGIDIVDGDGDAFRKRLRKDVYTQASVEKTSFLASVGGRDLMDLWVAVRQAHGHITDDDIEDEEEDDEDVKDWSHVSKGVDLINHSAKTEKPVQNRPLQEGDALYLLDRYLAERFPEGGDFRTADPSRVPQSTGDTQAFFLWLNQPEWRAHPHADSWRKINNNDYIRLGGFLKNNLRMLRSFNPVAKTHGAGATRVFETYFELGAPGTADPDPFSVTLGKATTKAAQLKAQLANANTSKKVTTKKGKDTKKRTIDDVAGEEDEEEAAEPPSKKRRSTGEASSRRTSTGSRRKSTTTVVEEDKEDEAPTTWSSLGTRTLNAGDLAVPPSSKKKGRRTKKTKKVEEDEDMLDLD